MCTVSLHDLSHELMAELVVLYTEDGDAIRYDDIPEIVRTLDEFGFFALRNAVVTACRYLHVSKGTVYRHLNSR